MRFDLAAFAWRLTRPFPHRLRLVISCAVGRAPALVAALREVGVYAREKHSGTAIIERPGDIAVALGLLGADRALIDAAESFADAWRYWSRGKRGSSVLRPEQVAAADKVMQIVAEETSPSLARC